MQIRKLFCGLFACSTLALLVIGCVIEERKYNPELAPPPGEPKAEGSVTLASTDLCQAYCKAVSQNCTGNYAVYLSNDADNDGLPDDCMSICKRLPAGTPNDKTDSVQCRLANANNAASEPSSASCAGAGPGGNALCGNTCETYCKLRKDICGEEEDVDVDACVHQCPVLEPGDIYNKDPMTKEDTLQCRLNHLVFASRSPMDATMHCWHTRVAPRRGMTDNPPCADQRSTPGDCKSYCHLVMFSCTGANQVYETESQCQAVCKAFPLGTAEQIGDQPGDNTVACRRYHAYAALDDAEQHCPHAGPAGDGHCGRPAEDNNCFSYCRILKRACTGQFYQMYLPQATQTAPAENADTDDLGSCMDSCKAIAGSAPNSRYSVQRAPLVDTSDDMDPEGDLGDVLQCRLYHAIKALGGSSGNSPVPTECAAALLTDSTSCQ